MKRSFRSWIAVAVAAAGLLSAGQARATADGYFDPTWAGGGRITFSGDFTNPSNPSRVGWIGLESSGNILLLGDTEIDTFFYPWIGELFGDGQFVPTFGVSDGSGRVSFCQLTASPGCGIGNVYAGLIQADGKYLVSAGSSLARILPQAHAIDASGVVGGLGYAPNGFTVNDVHGYVGASNAVVQLPDGKLLAAGFGQYSTANAARVFGIVRLNPDLSLDTSFNAIKDGLGVTFAGGVVIAVTPNPAEVTNILLQPDGGILLVGSGLNGSDSYTVDAVRLHADGSLDSSFGGGGKVELSWSLGSISYGDRRAKLDRAGRIVVALDGNLTGTSTSGALVLRLKSDGTPDSSFGNAGFFFDAAPLGCTAVEILDIVLDSAGRILVVGSCDSSFLVDRVRGDDGDLDVSFGINGHSYGVFNDSSTGLVTALALDAGGRPILGGISDLSGLESAAAGRLTYDLIFTNNFEITQRGCLPPDCN